MANRNVATRFQHTVLYSGILAAGFAFFTYVVFLIYCSTLIMGKYFYLSLEVPYREIPVVLAAFVFFELAFLFYILRVMKQRLELFQTRKHQLPVFLISSLIMLFCISLGVFAFRQPGLSSIVRLLSIISCGFVGSFPFFAVVHMFINLLIIRPLAGKIDLPFLGNDHRDDVLETAEFMQANLSIFNHCKRYNLKIGIVGLQIVNCDLLSRELSSAACAHFNRQLRFLLSENARSYEPWCELDGGHEYFCMIQVGEEYEFEYYVRRFSEVLSGTEFMLGSRRIEAEFKICALMPEPSDYDVDLYDNYESDIIKGFMNRVHEELSSQNETLRFVRGNR